MYAFQGKKIKQLFPRMMTEACYKLVYRVIIAEMALI